VVVVRSLLRAAVGRGVRNGIPMHGVVDRIRGHRVRGHGFHVHGVHAHGVCVCRLDMLAHVEPAHADSMGMDSMDMESMPMESACAGSTCASMSAGRSSQQISSENGQPLAGMNPGGMSTRDANATSMMPAMSVRLFRLPGLKRISHGVILGRGILPAKANIA
jgi:hypothetical protein